MPKIDWARIGIDLSIIAGLLYVTPGVAPLIFGLLGQLAAPLSLLLAGLLYLGFVILGKKGNDYILSIVSAGFFFSILFLPGTRVLDLLLYIPFGWRLLYLGYGGYLSQLSGIAIIAIALLATIGIETPGQPYVQFVLSLAVLISYRLNYRPKVKRLWELFG